MKTFVKLATAAFFLCLIFLSSCKKNKNTSGDTPKQTALSKVFENGKLVNEYLYSVQNKMVRINYYDEVTGLLQAVEVFEYDANGNMVKNNQYSETGKLWGIVNYYRDVNSRLLKHEYLSLSGADSGKITVRVKYSYDLAGRIGKFSWIDLVTEKIYTARELKYYNNGNLLSNEVFNFNPLQQLKSKLEYGPSTDSIPQSLQKFSAYPVDFTLQDFTAGGQHFFTYNALGVVTKEQKKVVSKRDFNSNGFITTQTFTIKNILPAGPDEIKAMRYEYIEL